MHKVKRNEPPEGLEELKCKFMKEYNENVNTTKEWNSLDHKLKKQIVYNLKEMYGGKCAYCESNIGDNSYAHIDHFKPKSKFPLLIFEYNNMNYCCQICNTNKLEKYDSQMIDPSSEDPEKHIKYECEKAVSIDEKGYFMIELLKLNDDERTMSRLELYRDIKEIINSLEIYCLLMDKMSDEDKHLAGALVENLIKRVMEHLKHGAEYYTMCKHNFEDSINKINKKLNN